MKDKIKRVWAREILNAKGRPSVEAEVETEGGATGVGSVPSGASRGLFEAFELYDGGDRYFGRGVLRAAGNVNREIAPALAGMSVLDQAGIDNTMIELDGTENKSRLGGNAMLAVSVASAKARAAALGVPLFQSFWKIPSPKMPGILATVISGGKFSPSSLEFEDYILSIEGLEPFSRAVEALSAIRFALERKLRADFGDFPLDGGALAPPLRSTDEAFAYMLNAARQCGFSEYVTLGLDVAASGIYDEKRGLYELGRGALDADGLIGVYKKLSADYPLTYLEDGFEENDFASFSKLAAALPGNVQIVGDDLFATNKKRLQKGLDLGCANGLLLKINQAGTVSEALETGALARELGCDIIVSLRSGETADDFIADLAVGLGARQMKLGSPVVMERNVKYNRLMRIESALLGTDGKGAL